MHIRVNIELSYIQIVMLAICPLFLIVNTVEYALYFAVATAICYLLSAFICYVFNKYLSNSVKIFITAILSTFIITMINFLIEEYAFLNLTVSNNYYFVVISTIVLSTDTSYVETKALVDNYFVKVLRSALAFGLFLIGFAIIKEFLAFGTIYNKQLFKYSGFEFFETITFDFILLGIISAIAELVYRIILKKLNEKQIVYAKFKKKIRNEKKYQYDTLRRKKLLASDVQKNVISDDVAAEIIQKEKENEDVVIEEEVGEETLPESQEKNKKRKKNKKFKVSKEAKIEQAIDQERKEGNDV